MIESILVEISKGIGQLFINPLFYWTIILVLLAGYRRIKNERIQFGVKIHDIFTEWKRTWLPAIVIGLVLSTLIFISGIVFSHSTLYMLSAVMILFSLALRFTLLPASYTIGLTYIILLFSPAILENQSLVDRGLFQDNNFIGLTLLLGAMILAEAYFLQRVRKDETFLRLEVSERGVWVGHHRLKKMSVIPVLLLVPGGIIEPFAPYWPLFSIGESSYGFVLFPFLLGFEYAVRGNSPIAVAKRLSRQLLLLGFIVLAVSIGDLYLKGLSLAALLIAIFGREFILYRFRVEDKRRSSYFRPHPEGVKILGVIPGSPAERLEIQAGEVIAKVNDKRVTTPEEFYKALSMTGAHFKLNVLDEQGEVRFIQSAFYEDDDYKLGLLFIKEPHQAKK